MRFSKSVMVRFLAVTDLAASAIVPIALAAICSEVRDFVKMFCAVRIACGGGE
ncbi:hypothetical protein D3C81_2315290 [compost metagenome]